MKIDIKELQKKFNKRKKKLTLKHRAIPRYIYIAPLSEWMRGDWKHYGIKSKVPKRRNENVKIYSS